MESGGLKRTAVRGMGWTTASTLTRFLITLVSTPLLARMLSPTDYGIAAMSALVIEIVALFGEFGFHTALIQRKRISRLDLETAFWTSAAIGLALALIVAAFAPAFAAFFKTETLTSVLYVAAVGLALTNLSGVHYTMLVRGMRFKQMALIEIVSGLVRVGVALVMTYLGYGFWSLVIGGLSGILSSALLRVLVVQWLPRVTFRMHRLRSILTVGKNVFIEQLLAYLSNNVDYIIVGRRLGAEPLGGYQMAFSLPEMVRSSLAQIVSRVMFPAYSRLQDDDRQLSRAYLQVVQFVSLVSFPALAGLIVVAPLFVPLYFGPQWTHIVLPLQFLCASGAIRAVGATAGPVFYAKDRADINAKLAMVRLPVLAIALWGGSYYGINGVAFAFMSVSLMWTFIANHFTAKIIGERRRVLYAAMLPAFVSSLVMTAVVGVASEALTDRTPRVINLFGLMVVGVVAYASVLAVLFRRQLDQLVGLAAQFRS